jgi:hypothetical protein
MKTNNNMKTNPRPASSSFSSLQYNLLITLLLLISCKKNDPEFTENFTRTPKPEGTQVYGVATLDSYSSINKKTSWYQTTLSFSSLFNPEKSYYTGFEITPDLEKLPYNRSNTHNWGAQKSYYWFSKGTYLYTDLTGDGFKDLWAFYFKSPWPTNEKGLHLFSEYEKDSTNHLVQHGLH